jgi:hypothetical protein
LKGAIENRLHDRFLHGDIAVCILDLDRCIVDEDADGQRERATSWRHTPVGDADQAHLTDALDFSVAGSVTFRHLTRSLLQSRFHTWLVEKRYYVCGCRNTDNKCRKGGFDLDEFSRYGSWRLLATEYCALLSLKFFKLSSFQRLMSGRNTSPLEAKATAKAVAGTYVVATMGSYRFF